MIQAMTRVESSTTTPLEQGPQHGAATVWIRRRRVVDDKRRPVNGGQVRRGLTWVRLAARGQV
jgi:hypothetical protein